MMRVIGDRVLVALPPKHEQQDATTGYTYQLAQTVTTANSGDGTPPSGIIIAKPADAFNVEIATRGIVMQLGERSNTCDLDDVRSAVHSVVVEQASERRSRVGLYMTAAALARLLRIVGDRVDQALMRMQPAPFDVQVGDCVLFPPTAGDQVHYDGIDYVILRESEILGVVDPKQEAA